MVNYVDVIYARFSSEQQRVESNADQERRCREGLDRMGIAHTHFKVITDEALSGTLDARPGLEEIKQFIYSGRLGTLVVTEQSRLSRGDNAKGLIKDIIFHGGRFISLSEGIDTNKKGWQLLVSFSELHHSQANTDTAERVRGGQEGRVLDGNGSAGDFPFGFISEYQDPAAALAYNGRGPKPKKVVVIHEPAAKVVQEVFERFAIQKQSITKIVKWWQANKERFPSITKSRIHHEHVRRILKNKKYIGHWEFGNTTTLRDSDGNKKQTKIQEHQRVTKVERPTLRIIPQDIWDQAQARLAQLEDIYGQKPEGKKRGPAQHYQLLYAERILDGLVHCGVCGSRLHIGGNGVKRMGCPKHSSGICSMIARVPYAKAEVAVTEVLTGIFTGYPEWVASTVTYMKKEIEQLSAAVPDSQTTDAARISKLNCEIKNFMNAIANGLDSPDTRKEQLERETERNILQTRMAEREKLRAVKVTMPDDDYVRQELSDLPTLLAEADPAAIAIAREMLGQITADPVSIPGKKKGYIRLCFKIDCWPAIVKALSGKLPHAVLEAVNSPDLKAVGTREFAIDLGAPTVMDSWGPQIVQWRKDKVTLKEISARTGLKISNVHIVWKRWVKPSEAA